MEDQPWDLNETWPVGRKWWRFTNASKKFRGHFGAKKTSNFWPLFSRLPHSTPHISGTKRQIDKQKCLHQSTMFSLNVDLLSVTFNPETAEIRWLILTHPIGCHYAATNIVATCLVSSFSFFFKNLLWAKWAQDLRDRLSPNFTIW